MQLKRCEQCGKAMWSKRSTKKTCSESCKQKRKRNVPRTDYYDIWNEPMEHRINDILNLIADNDKQAFAKLKRMRDKYGRNAMLAAVAIIADLELD